MNVVVLCPKPSLRWKYWKNQPVHREYGYWFLDENIPNQDKFRLCYRSLVHRELVVVVPTP